MRKRSRQLLREHGVADMPLGVDIIEPPMMFELQKAGLKVQDGQQGCWKRARSNRSTRSRC